MDDTSAIGDGGEGHTPNASVHTKTHAIANNAQAPQGFLLVDKPAGVTSRSVDNLLKSKLREVFKTSSRTTAKVGHAGTLDPFATGVLILGVGNDTKLLHKMEGATKEYIATIRLGWSTPTDDNTSSEYDSLARTSPFELDERRVEAKLAEFVGKQMQTPCAFSAKRIDGKRAYEMSRAGEDVLIKAKEVEIFELKVLSFESAPKSHYYDVQIRVAVSAGTYIRAIARDLGASLGVGGHLVALERVRVGNFTIDQCVSTKALEKIVDAKSLDKLLLKYPLGSAITLGNFDGVHLGHAHLLRATHDFAKARGGRSLAIVIDDAKDTQITPLKARVNYILQYVDEVKVINYKDVQTVSFEEFLDTLLDQYHFHTFCMTEDMRFGKDRLGTLETVQHYLYDISAPTRSVRYAPSVQCVDLMQYNGDKISSSRVRQLLLDGKVDLANQMLGRAYKISGEVVHGYKRGRKIGFPTANIATRDASTSYVTPKDGVYFGYATIPSIVGKNRFPAMISVGSNPTFKNNCRSVEVHIPGRDDFDLYGKNLSVSFYELMREVKRFEGVDALIAQLSYDSKRTLELAKKYT